jgi:hypothetical protein
MAINPTDRDRAIAAGRDIIDYIRMALSDPDSILAQQMLTTAALRLHELMKLVGVNTKPTATPQSRPTAAPIINPKTFAGS